MKYCLQWDMFELIALKCDLDTSDDDLYREQEQAEDSREWDHDSHLEE